MTKYFAVIAAVIGLIVAFCLAAWIKKADEGTDRMKEIAGYIREGAMVPEKRIQDNGYRYCCVILINRYLH